MSELDWECIAGVAFSPVLLLFWCLVFIGIPLSAVRTMRARKLAVWIPSRRFRTVLVILFVLDAIVISGSVFMAKWEHNEPVRFASEMRKVWPASDRKYPPKVSNPTPLSYSLLRQCFADAERIPEGSYLDGGVRRLNSLLTDEYTIVRLEVPRDSGPAWNVIMSIPGAGAFPLQIERSPSGLQVVVSWSSEFGDVVVLADSVEDMEPYFSLIVCRVRATERLNNYLKEGRPADATANARRLAEFHRVARSSMPKVVHARQFDWDTASRKIAEAHDVYIAGVLPDLTRH